MIMTTIPHTLAVIMALFLYTYIHLCQQLEGLVDDTTCTNLPRCRCNMTHVDCSHTGLSSIPDIPVTALTLDLSRNDITTIPTRAFSNLSKLQSLDLNSNKIRAVEPLSFEGLESLTDIDLAGNMIDTIPTRAFVNLSKLQSLDLSSNEIRTVESLAFEGLKSLTALILSLNKIDTIPTQQFSKLSKLQSLDLSDNRIRIVEPLAFEGLENLTGLILHSNPIDTIKAQQFSKLSKLLYLGLSNNQIRTVEPLAFEGLENLTNIDLYYNMIDTIPTEAFSRLSQLQNLDLKHNQIQTLEPLAFEGLEGLTDLILHHNMIETISTQAFSRISKLQRLDMSFNQIRSIEPLTLEGLESLTDLKLYNNKIDTISTHQFSKLSQLQSLDLSGNQIQTVEPLAFEGLESLVNIGLANNMIDTIPTRVFAKLSNLQSLDVINNKIHAVKPFAFAGLQNLTKLCLYANKIQTLENKSFANISRLNSLDLRFNSIQIIEAGAFTGTESISVIELTNNMLSEVPSIGPQPRLSKLDLSDNLIVNAIFPPTYKSSYSTLSVDLSSNNIETLDRFTFSSLAGTTIVDMKLSYNNIRHVGPGTFDPLASIGELYLDYNPLSIEALKNIADSCSRNQVTLAFNTRLSLIDGISAFMNLGIRLGMCSNFSSGYVFEEFRNLTIIWLTKDNLVQFSMLDFPGKKNVLAMDLADSDFFSFPKYLPTSLESLDLRGTRISEINQNDLRYLGGLKTLLLTRNRIVDLWQDAFYGLGNLRVLDLGKNRIGSVSRDIFEPLQNLTSLFLGTNMINDLPKLSKPLVSLRVLDLSDNGCKMVERPLYESFPSLQILHFEENNLGKTMFLSDKSGSLFSGLIKLEEIYISSNEIRGLPSVIFRDQGVLRILNISRNQISGWGPKVFQFTRNIAKVDISFNRISVLMESNLRYLTNLKVLNLKDNQFVCSCDLLWFREWIDSTSVALPDKESYTCHGPEEWRGKPLLEFTKDKINCTMIPTIVGAISGALLLSAIFVILVYRNRWRLRLRLYLLSKRGRHFLRDVKGHVQHPNYGAINDNDSQDNYDAYISCSDRDYDWVIHHLLPGIDNGHYDDDMFGGDFKLYFDPRDQEPGTMAIVKIFENMSRSRKVIVVLTQDYVSDGMNIFELDQATTLYHDQDLDDIIVIKVGDVPTRRVPAHLYTQMRTDRFIEWENDRNSIEGFKAKIKDRLLGDRVDLC